jgi:hypothetical protein
MDLEATWQLHRKFIVTVGGGALAFALLSYGVTSVEASADRMAKSNAREQTDLRADLSGLAGAEAVEKGKKIALETTAAPAITKAVTWTVDPKYLLAEEERSKSPAIAYARRVSMASEEVGRKADKVGTPLPRNQDSKQPELGVESGGTLDAAHAPEALARVDVARRILLAAIDAGVSKVVALRHAEATYDKLEGDAGFLRRIGVTVAFEGTAQDLARFVSAFEVDQSFLELSQCRVRRAKDARPEEGRLEVELEVGALTVEKEKPEDAKAGAQTQNPDDAPIRRPPPGRRRRD